MTLRLVRTPSADGRLGEQDDGQRQPNPQGRLRRYSGRTTVSAVAGYPPPSCSPSCVVCDGRGCEFCPGADAEGDHMRVPQRHPSPAVALIYPYVRQQVALAAARRVVERHRIRRSLG